MPARARQTRGSHTPAPSAAAAFTPDALSVAARHLEVGGEWVSSFAVVGFPREVHPGWLAPLLTYPGRLDVSVHVEPIDPATFAPSAALLMLKTGPASDKSCEDHYSRTKKPADLGCCPESAG